MLAIVAHPDDESFGLGAILASLHAASMTTGVLCFTHGEASTLGHVSEGDLGVTRTRELADAAIALGVGPVRLLDHPDGGLAGVPLEELTRPIVSMAVDFGAELLLAFDEGGVTGHPDHERATEAARAAAALLGLDVLGWTIPKAVASTLNAEFGTRFVGRRRAEIDVRLTVDRECQHLAISRHRSQATDNPVLWRRLELLGDEEAARFLPLGV